MDLGEFFPHFHLCGPLQGMQMPKLLLTFPLCLADQSRSCNKILELSIAYKERGCSSKELRKRSRRSPPMEDKSAFLLSLNESQMSTTILLTNTPLLPQAFFVRQK